MKESKRSQRRAFFIQLGSLVAAPAIMLFSACRQKKDNEEEASRDCTDLSDLTSEDLAARKKFAYTDESPVGDQRCENCNLFLPVAQERKCGGCLLFKGAVQPSGYCTYWAPQL